MDLRFEIEPSWGSSLTEGAVGAKRFLQKWGVGCLKMLGPASVLSSIPMIVITALQREWVLNHWGMEKAFVESEIDSEISSTLHDGRDELSVE